MRRRPNIIVLIADALRARSVSCYGYPIRTTPHLDAFAAENVLFRRAFSAATWTIPSHVCLLTGLYLSQHRIESIKADRALNAAVVTLPDALRHLGYRTAAFSQNMLFSPDYRLDQGFDEFHSAEEMLGARPLSRRVQTIADGSTGFWRLAARYLRKMIAPRRVLDSLYDWIQANPEGSPFFLFANVLSPHFPWAVPPDILLKRRALNPFHLLKTEWVTLKGQWQFNAGNRRVTETHRRIWLRLYDAAVLHVDREIGRFLNRLRRWKDWPQTIVVVTADHGEMLGDYRDIVGHMLSLHDNLIRVPLVVHHPDYPRGLAVDHVVQTLDLYPSTLEWTGCPAGRVPLAQLQRPPLSVAVAAAHDRGGYAFAEEDYTDSYDVIGKLLEVNPSMDPKKYPRQQVAVRSSHHKYIWFDDRPGELYDLDEDPGEESNLLHAGGATELPVLADLRDALQAWRRDLELFPPRCSDKEVEIDGIVMERLRSLGYVD